MDEASALLAAYDVEVRPTEWKNLPPGVVAEDDGPVVRVVGFHRGFISPPPVLSLEGAELVKLIERQREIFAARGEAVEWKTRSHDRPIEVIEHLQAAGFHPEERETVLIGSAEAMALQPVVLPRGVVIHQTTSDDDMHRIAAMESAVWEEELGGWRADDLIRSVHGTPDQVEVFLAENEGGQVVSAGWLEHQPGSRFAGLWGGSTLEHWRHQGIYRALVVQRAKVALQRGALYLQVDASDNSRPILERLGFVAITSTTPYVWTPPEL